MHRFVLVCAAFAAVTPALAQDAERYQLERTEDGYVRLDTQTGAASLCTERGTRLVCVPASEEREAGALQDRITELEARVAALEQQRSAAQLPSEEEFEQTLGYMERFFRTFLGIVSDFEDRSDEGRPLPPPDRT